MMLLWYIKELKVDFAICFTCFLYYWWARVCMRMCVCVCVCVDLSSKQIFLARIYTLNIFFLHSFHFLLLLLVVFLLSSLCIVYEGWKDVDMNHYFTLRVMFIPKFFQYLQTRYNWFCGNINEAIVAGDWCMSWEKRLLVKTICSWKLTTFFAHKNCLSTYTSKAFKEIHCRCD